MSELAVRLTTIDEVQPHPNADRLEIAVVGGWQCIVPKGEYERGDEVIYFPPDTVLPTRSTDWLGVTPYCQHLADDKQRIRCTRLRGEPSFGVIASREVLATVQYCLGDDPPTITNDDVIAYFGAEKYTPPVKPWRGAGGNSHAAPDHPRFPKYTSIENLRNYPDIFLPGEELVATEKLHGTNCRVGIVDGERMAGSHNRRVVSPENPEYPFNDRYWMPFNIVGVRELLSDLHRMYKQVVLFGEIFGKGVQPLEYGRSGLDFAAFDILADGHYFPYRAFVDYCVHYNIPTVNQVAIIAYSGLSSVVPLAEGRTTHGGNHIREGVVLRPLIERHDPKIGRVIMKYISNDYLLKKFEDLSES